MKLTLKIVSIAGPTIILLCTLVSADWPLPKEALATQDEANVVENSTLDYLERTFRGIDLALDFFWREKEQVNLDTIIGTRIVEATMNIILERLHSFLQSDKVPRSVYDHILAIRNYARDVSNGTVPFIIRNEPRYYAKIGTILNPGIFQLNYDSRDVSASVPVWPHNPNEAMGEDESDDCLAEIFGTRTGYTCDIANECWRQMTKPGYNEYSLSHEIFYLEIAEGLGCQRQMMFQMQASSQASLSSLHELFCANMLAEAERIARLGFLPVMRDLFMEQAALCGILGYREFFNSDWLEQILSWQDKKDGCYKWGGWQLPRNDLPEDKERRVKREEKRVSRGCLCHRTTVAASALAQYARYILEVMVDEEMTS